MKCGLIYDKIHDEKLTPFLHTGITIYIHIYTY